MFARKFLIAAIAVTVSGSAASAGGFSFSSYGGNLGNWAYGDAAAYGTANISGYGKGEAYTDGGASTSTKKGYYGTSSTSSAGQIAGFSGYGHGSAQVAAGSVAGSGVGLGIGFKAGSFSSGGKRR